jgi:hypothetical protein
MIRFAWRGSYAVGNGYFSRYAAPIRAPVVARTTSEGDLASLKAEIEKKLAHRTKVAIPATEIDANLLVRTGVCTAACDIESEGRLDDVFVFPRSNGEIEVLGRGLNEKAAYLSLALCIELLFGKKKNKQRDDWLD